MHIITLNKDLFLIYEIFMMCKIGRFNAQFAFKNLLILINITHSRIMYEFYVRYVLFLYFYECEKIKVILIK